MRRVGRPEGAAGDLVRHPVELVVPQHGRLLRVEAVRCLRVGRVVVRPVHPLVRQPAERPAPGQHVLPELLRRPRVGVPETDTDDRNPLYAHATALPLALEPRITGTLRSPLASGAGSWPAAGLSARAACTARCPVRRAVESSITSGAADRLLSACPRPARQHARTRNPDCLQWIVRHRTGRDGVPGPPARGRPGRCPATGRPACPAHADRGRSGAGGGSRAGRSLRRCR